MIADIFFIISICSPFLVVVFFAKKRAEELIPITCMSIIAVLYVFGMAGHINIGVLIILALTLTSVIAAFFYSIRKKEFITSLKNLLSPAFCFFLTLYVLFLFLDYGRVAYATDEFSHWMDVVKIMDQLDDFATNSKSDAWFASYPPAVALFEVYYQKMFHLGGGIDFCEWRMDVAYKILMISVFLPLLKDLKHKEALKNISIFMLVFVVPVFLYSYAYTTVLIDPILSCFYGIGITMPVFYEKRDKLYYTYMGLLVFTLTLTKAVGLFFAAVVAIAMLYDDIQLKKKKKGLVFSSVFSLIATVIAKLSWNYEIKSSNTYVVFGNKIDVVGYTKMLVFQNDNTWRQEAVNRYAKAFYSVGPTFDFGVIKITIAPIVICAVFIVAFLFVYFVLFRPLRENVNFKRITGYMPFWGGLLAAQAVIYIYYLGATYISNFSEIEALELASYLRYVRMVFVAILFFLVFAVVFYLKNVSETLIHRFVLRGLKSTKKDKLLNKKVLYSIYIMICLASIGFCLGEGTVRSFITRSSVRDVKALRETYRVITDQILEKCEEGDVVCYVDSDGYYLQCRFCVRPVYLVNYTDDLELMEDYDYVAIRKVPELFRQKYSNRFLEEIKEETIYCFDDLTGKWIAVR